MTQAHIEYFHNWPYDEALDWMQQAHQAVNNDPTIFFVGVGSHRESVITLGRDVKKSTIHQSLLGAWPDVIIRHTERGGGATVHEPGQIVLYPVLNLKHLRLTPRMLVNLLEQAAIEFCGDFGVMCHVIDGFPGIFLGEKKIGFIGLRIHQSISSHGLALNVFNTANLYRAIDPCGIAALPITSLFRHKALECTLHEAISCLAHHFIKCLNKVIVVDGLLVDEHNHR